MTLADINRLLDLLSEGIVDQQRIIDGIRSRKVDFNKSPENIQKLRARNAPEPIIAAILAVAPTAPEAPKPAPPPPPAPTTTLTIICAPQECEIAVNGVAKGSTRNGRLVVEKQPIGRTVIHANRAGFFGAEATVTLSEQAAAVPIRLTPTPEARLTFGRKVLGEVLRAVGTGLRPEMTRDLGGNGSASIWSKGGALVEYNLIAEFGPPNLAELEVSGPPGFFVLQCRGFENCRPRTSGKSRFNGAKRMRVEDTELSTNLRLFRRYHFFAFIERALGPQVRALADSETASQLRLEMNDEGFVLTLTEDKLPSLVTYESKAGPGTGMQVTYGDYGTVTSLKYPRRTTIRLPESKQAGIQVRFDTLRAGIILRERDFPQ